MRSYARACVCFFALVPACERSHAVACERGKECAGAEEKKRDHRNKLAGKLAKKPAPEGTSPPRPSAARRRYTSRLAPDDTGKTASQVSAR
eukprot:297075-Pleurochrysis_carterae.AAC.2